jgi:hypothetical protein
MFTVVILNKRIEISKQLLLQRFVAQAYRRKVIKAFEKNLGVTIEHLKKIDFGVKVPLPGVYIRVNVEGFEVCEGRNSDVSHRKQDCPAALIAYSGAIALSDSHYRI